jgi:hypothetical protein
MFSKEAVILVSALPGSSNHLPHGHSAPDVNFSEE